MDTLSRIRQIFNQNLDEELTIGDREPLESVDINSIAFIKIAIAIEDEFQVHFDNTMLSIKKFASLYDLGAYIESLMQASKTTPVPPPQQ